MIWWIWMVLQKRYVGLDDLATPDGSVVLSTEEELVYTVYFRQICKRYNIDFANADQEERTFARYRRKMPALN